jgi:endonuclease YncB( thermonuclease family)
MSDPTDIYRRLDPLARSNGERSYERLVGVCFLPNGTDIGAEIIRRGLALDCQRWSFGRYRALEPDGVREITPHCRPPGR